MMHWWYDDGGSWGMGLFAGLMMLGFWALVVAGIVALVRGWRLGSTSPRRTPEQILDERFARGEVDAEEYTQRRRMMAEARAADSESKTGSG